VAARFLLHPWDPDTLLTITEQDDVGDEQLELGFEVDEDAWQPLSPAAAPPRTVHFVDGARRHDAAGTLGAWPCLFTVIAVGSVTSRLGAPVAPPAHAPARRYVIVGTEEDVPLEPVRVARYGLEYEPRRVAGGEHHLAAEAQRLMLRWEAELAEEVAHAHPGDVVLLDGPLRSDASVQNVLGFVKSTSRERLPPSQRGVLADLAPGQRSPVYRVHGGDRSLLSRLEWVMRPRGAAPGVDPRLGLVRVQANSALSRAEAAALADWTAATLPAYATDYHQDPRAPQQLLIVKDLESDLRRSFGHRDLLLTALRQELSG